MPPGGNILSYHMTDMQARRYLPWSLPTLTQMAGRLERPYQLRTLSDWRQLRPATLHASIIGLGGDALFFADAAYACMMPIMPIELLRPFEVRYARPAPSIFSAMDDDDCKPTRHHALVLNTCDMHAWSRIRTLTQQDINDHLLAMERRWCEKNNTTSTTSSTPSSTTTMNTLYTYSLGLRDLWEDH